MSRLLSYLCLPWTLLALSGCPLSTSNSGAPPAAESPQSAVGAPPTVETPHDKDRPISIDKEAIAMPETPDAEPGQSPAISAAILRRQTLDLIGSLRTLDDLERPHVASILRAELQKVPEIKERYLYEGRTVEGWEYGVSVARLHGVSDPFTTRIGFDNGVEAWTDQKPTYCTMDFEAFAQEIVALGYKREPKRSTFGGKPSWEFSRDVPERSLMFVVSLPLYYLGDGYPSGQACVQAVEISGNPLDE